MSSRGVFITTLGLVLLGAGAWWKLADKESQEGRASAFYNAPPPPFAPPSPRLSVEGDLKSTPEASPDNPPQDAVQAQDKTITEKFKLLFAGRANPDPALSKELERVIQYALDASVDHARFDVESIVCREYMCQIVSLERVTAPGDPIPFDSQQVWGPILKNVLSEMTDTELQNSRTGERISKPRVRQVEFMNSGGGIITYIGFHSEKP